MSSREVTLSIRQIKFFVGIFLLIIVAFIGFAISEGGRSVQASQDSIGGLSAGSTATPFLPGGDVDALLLDTVEGTEASPTPRPTVVYEDGKYPTAIPEVLPTLSDITPFSILADVNPLTGRPPDSPELLDRRPVASKITLYPRAARPQYGLTKADVVYEYYIEWGLTRFVAVFYGSNPDQIGPVRSGRFFDEHIARMYQSYLVFKYADKRVLDHFKTTDISDFLVLPLFGNCSPYFVGEEDRDIYNNIFFDLTRFGPCLDENGYDNERPRLRGGYFSSRLPFTGQQALGIFTHYSVDDYHYWGYEPSNKRYYREQETDDTRDGKPPSYAPLVDNLTGEQVSTDNLVFLFIPHSFANKNDKEDQVYHIDPQGTGRAYLFRDGIVVPAYWRRFAIDQPLELTDLNGKPLSLKPGRTFYEVLSEASTFENQGTQWYFYFEP